MATLVASSESNVGIAAFPEVDGPRRHSQKGRNHHVCVTLFARSAFLRNGAKFHYYAENVSKQPHRAPCLNLLIIDTAPV